MQRVTHILSQLLSILLHPLFIPSYGMLYYMLFVHERIPQLPHTYILISIIGTMILTAVIPISLIVILWRRGTISSLHIHEAQERTTPYIYSVICFGFWSYFIYKVIKLPLVWLFIALGTTLALLLLTVINRWWKISAHLTAMGGLLGGVCSLALCYATTFTTPVIIVLTISLMLMYARIYLQAHTPLQVVAGYLLGIACTFTPNLIMYYV